MLAGDLAASSASNDAAVAYRIDAAHTGSQPADSLKPPLALQWRITPGHGQVSYPLAVGGRVFFTTAGYDALNFGEDAALHAVDESTGGNVWGPKDLGPVVWAAAAYDAGTIFALNYSGRLLAIDATTGNQVWAVQLPDSVFTSPPTAYKGIVYTAGQGTAPTAFAVSEANGAILWSRSITGGSFSSPALSDSGDYSAYFCPSDYDLSPLTGSVNWHSGPASCATTGGSTSALFDGALWVRDVTGSFTLDQATGMTRGTFSAKTEPPAFAGNAAYYVNDGTAALEAHDLTSGALLWSFKANLDQTAAPIIANGYVYVNGGDGTLYCIDAATGKLSATVNAGAGRWADWGLDGQTINMPSGSAIAESHLFVPGGTSIAAYVSGGAVSTPVATQPNQSVAYQVDTAHSGVQANVALTPPLSTAWSADLGGTISYPLIAGGRVFVTVDDGSRLPDGSSGSHLYALDQATGKSVWGPVLLNAPKSAAAYDNGRVYALTSGTRAEVRAFDAQTGTELWSRLATDGQAFVVATNGLVYLPENQGILALDGATGGLVWTQPANGDTTVPAVAAGGVFVDYSCQIAERFDAASGAPTWNHPGGCTSGGGGRASVIARGRDFIRPVDPNVTPIVLNSTSGSQVGTYSSITAPAIGGSVQVELDGHTLEGHDPATGTLLWSFAGDGGLDSAPLIVNGDVYEASSSGTLYALAPATGLSIWSASLGSAFVAPDEVFNTQLSGMGAGEGMLVVPAGNRLVAFTSPGASSQTVAVLPALSNGAYGGYHTAATIQNTGTSPATIHIAYFNQIGAAVGGGDAISNLPVNASWTVAQDNGNSFPGTGGDAVQAGSAIVFSDQPVAAFVNEFAPGNVGDASSYTGVQPVGGVGATLYAPTIVNNAYGGYTTGVGLLNVGSSPTDVTLTYRDDSGSVVKTQTMSGMAPHAYRALYAGDPALGLPNGFVGTATIVSSAAQPLAAVVNEAGPGGQFSSYDAVPSGNTTLDAPVALNNAYGGYYTGMAIQNISGNSGTVSVTYYNAAGASILKQFSISAYGALGVYQGSATDGPSPGAYAAVIQSALPLAAIVNEVAPANTTARQSTSYNAMGAGSATSHLPLVENGGPDPWNTGDAIMNTGVATTTVTVTYYSSDTGAVVGTAQTQTIASHAVWDLYQPAGGLPAGTRATAVITASSGGQVAVICNESSSMIFMSYDAQ